MALLRLEQLEEGMELTADVVDRNGNPLVRSGSVLSDKDFRRFQMWGISEVEVAGEEGEDLEVASEAIDPETLQRVEPPVRELFSHCTMEHPFIAHLFQEALTSAARKDQSGNT